MWSIVGHDWVIKMWQHGIAQGRVAHAYLLTGPPQIGKTMLAQSFAQALNCTSDDRPCGQCLSCCKIASGNHPDVRIIESSGNSIKIDQIRQLQSGVSLSAHESPWKVYILRNMDQATIEAANCLLKTLEEPPSRVLLLLTASSSNALLPTIVSRCQLLPLRPLTTQTVRQLLSQKWQVEPEKAQLLAQLSGGRIGWAIAAAEDDGLLEKRTQTITDLLRVADAHRFERMRYAEKLSTQRDGIPAILDVWKTWWRDLLLVKLGMESMAVNVDRLGDLHDWETKYDIQQIRDFLAHLLAAAHRLEQDVNARLALEALFLKLPPANESMKGQTH